MKRDASEDDFGVVLDRHGDWIEHAIACDTFTGDVECVVHAPDGHVLHDGNGGFVTELYRFAAPLRVLPIPGGWPEDPSWFKAATKARPV